MVIRIPGLGSQQGPQPGPDPAWGKIRRPEGQDGSLKVQAYKPDVAAYRILGRARATAKKNTATPERRDRNRHNSSVYISTMGRHKDKSIATASNLARVPVIGEIAAGQYDVTVAFQEYDCLAADNGVVVDRALARGGAYALRVRGTSMTHVGIEPGDVVVIRPQDWAEDGDFVVANYSDGEAGGSEGLATLKRFYKRHDHIFLQSATAEKDPIRLFPNRRAGASDPDPVKVQGVVTLVLKNRD